jgi:hypothetical protein
MALPTVGNDYDLDAGLAGLNFRLELNAIIEALNSMNSAVGLPPITFPFMLRGALDTSPNEIQIRNPSDNAFLKLAEITDSAITMFSNGAAVPSLGTEQTFTANQNVDRSGAAGVFTVGSDLSAGVSGRLDFRAHNSVGANVSGVQLACTVENNAQGAEDFFLDVQVVRGGSTQTVARLGSIADFTQSGGQTLNATVLQQAGITLAQIVREAAGRFQNQADFSVDIASFTQDQEGSMFRFNGSSNVTVRLNKLARNTIIGFQNESPADATITFAAAVVDPVTDFQTSRLTLPNVNGESPTCFVHWYLSDGRRVNILGDNV